MHPVCGHDHETQALADGGVDLRRFERIPFRDDLDDARLGETFLRPLSGVARDAQGTGQYEDAEQNTQ
jgi:hypothetical protein